MVRVVILSLVVLLAVFSACSGGNADIGDQLARIDANLVALAQGSGVSPEGQEQLLIRGLRLYLSDQWMAACSLLGKGLAGVDDPFGQYLLLSYALERDAMTADALIRFVGLEPSFRTCPPFYHRLWRAMKKGPGRYTFSNARSVLERVIQLAPSSEEAAESRVELGRLIGVDASAARSILLGSELDLVYARLSAGVLMMRTAARIPAVVDYLAEQATKADGALTERLAQIL